MKKIISIALFFVMLLSITGVTVNVGYCKMKHKTTYSFKKKGCCCKKDKSADQNSADEDDDGGCCKNKKVTICKSLDNYKQSTVLEIQKHIVFADVVRQPPFIVANVFPVVKNTENIVIVKPPGQTIKRTILYRQFLI